MDNNIQSTKINGVFIIKRPVFSDARGFFHEIARLSELKDYGIEFSPIQYNHSRSLPNVIRAIHAEDWQKLVYPLTGKMFSAIVDVRPDSESFGMVETFTFDAEDDKNLKALFLPRGVGNSICVSGDKPVDYIYLCDEYWCDEKAKGFAWDDPDLNIKWPVKDPIISDRDRKNPRLRDVYPEKFK